MEFSKRLKIVITDSGIKLKEISDLTGISYDMIKQYNQGKRNPKRDKIQLIAAIPQLEPWREFLLEPELTADEAEFMTLFARLKAQGRESEALQILRDLEEDSNDE